MTIFFLVVAREFSLEIIVYRNKKKSYLAEIIDVLFSYNFVVIDFQLP